MSERERKALEEIGEVLKNRSEEERAVAAAIFAAYAAGKAAGRKKSAPEGA